MFQCTSCGRITNPGEKMGRVPAVLRQAVTNHVRIDSGTGREVGRTVGVGIETVREGQLCHECASNPREPKMVERVNRIHTITV